MALTPASIRRDLKCGKGAISQGEKCRVGPASTVKEQGNNNRSTQARSNNSNVNSKVGLLAVGAYAGLIGYSLLSIKNVRHAYEAKFSPAQRFQKFTGSIGNPKEVLGNIQFSNKVAAPSLFGDVRFGKLNNKDVIVKTVQSKLGGGFQIDQMQATGMLSAQTASALKAAQANLQVNEVQAAKLAGEFGIGPKLIAAGDNKLISEVAQGRPLTSQSRLIRYVQGPGQREIQNNPPLYAKKAMKLKWLEITKGSDISKTHKDHIIRNMGKMHTLGIAHNDLHPGNVFISKKGAQFIDYGTSERGGGAVASEFVKMMNKPRTGLQQAGGMGYNLQTLDPKGYAKAEQELKKAIGKNLGKLTAADINKALDSSSNREALEKKMQDIVDGFYTQYEKRPRVPTRNDTEDGKKYTKVVTNPETGRKNKVRYGAKGYRIAPGTDKGDRYCARSFGDMKSHGKDCGGADRNTPLCLSRAKWACSGKTSRKSSAPARKDNFIQHYAPIQLQPPNKRDWNPNSQIPLIKSCRVSP